MPATSEESLCPGHTANLALYKQTVLKASEEFAASGRALPSRTVVLELDRNPLKTFGEVWGWGKIPSLRTSGPQLFLLSCEDLSKPWQEMRLHRWLTLAERFRALGQRGTLATRFAKDSHAIHAIGNALSPVRAASSSGQPIGASGRGQRGFEKLCKMSSRKCADPCPHQASRNLGRPSRSRSQTRLCEAGQPKTSHQRSQNLGTRRFFQKKLIQRPSLHLKRKLQQLESQRQNRFQSQRLESRKLHMKRKPPRLQSHRLQLKRKPQRLQSRRLQLKRKAPKTPKPQASAEEEAPKTPKHTPDDLELELERLIDEADRQEMDIASETEKSALPWGSRSMLSEKAAELFDSFTNATASRPANWSSPASKSADKESPEQSSRGKASNTGSPEQSSGGKAGNTGSPEQSSRGKAGNTGSPEQSSGGKAGNTGKA